MIEKVSDLDLDQLNPEDDGFLEQLELKIKEKLGLSIEEIKASLSLAIINNAEEMALECPSIAPYGKYDTLLEDNDSMTDFFKKESSKTENMTLSYIEQDSKFENLIKFVFINSSVDHLQGTVFVSKAGTIKHSYPRIEV